MKQFATTISQQQNTQVVRPPSNYSLLFSLNNSSILMKLHFIPFNFLIYAFIDDSMHNQTFCSCDRREVCDRATFPRTKLLLESHSHLFLKLASFKLASIDNFHIRTLLLFFSSLLAAIDMNGEEVLSCIARRLTFATVEIRNGNRTSTTTFFDTCL